MDQLPRPFLRGLLWIAFTFPAGVLAFRKLTLWDKHLYGLGALVLGVMLFLVFQSYERRKRVGHSKRVGAFSLTAIIVGSTMLVLVTKTIIPSGFYMIAVMGCAFCTSWGVALIATGWKAIRRDDA